MSLDEKKELLKQLQKDIEINSNQQQKKTIFTEQQKREIAFEAKKVNNVLKTAFNNGISESTLRYWIQTLLPKNEIIQSKKRNRQVPFLLMEINLMIYIIEKRQQHIPLSKGQIQKEALNLFKQLKQQKQTGYVDNKFTGSNGWFYNFKKRWNLSYRTSTHAILSLSDNIYKEIGDNLKQLADYRYSQIKEGKQLTLINIDEVPLNFDITTNKTYDFKGSKNIQVIQSLGTKLRLTIVITAMKKCTGNPKNDQGYLLKPLFIFKPIQKSQIQHDHRDQCIVIHNKKGWQTQEIYLSYLESIVSNYKKGQNEKLILIHDKFKGHFSDAIADWSKKNEIEIHTLAAGSTFLTQPIDTHFAKQFKDKVRNSQESWKSDFISQKLNLNKTGQIKAPSYQQMIKWSIDSLSSFQSEYICDSFNYCGLSSSLNTKIEDQLNKKLYNNQYIQQQIKSIINDSELNSDKDLLLETVEKFEDPSSYEPCKQIESFISKNIPTKILEMNQETESTLMEIISPNNNKKDDNNIPTVNQEETDGSLSDKSSEDELDFDFVQNTIIYQKNPKSKLVIDQQQPSKQKIKIIVNSFLPENYYKEDSETIFFESFNQQITFKYSRKEQSKPKKSNLLVQNNKITNYQQ